MIAPDQLQETDSHRPERPVKRNGQAQAELGQFMTPSNVAGFMASFFRARNSNVRLLDAGAGTGSLFGAYVFEACAQSERTSSISITAYEIDASLLPMLREAVRQCEAVCNCSA